MMKKLYYILFLYFTMVSCQGNNEVIADEDSDEKIAFCIKSSIAPMTRVQDDEWEVGDKIAVTIYDDDASSLLKRNLSFITSEGGLIGQFSPTVFPFYLDGVIRYRMVACYPYDSNEPEVRLLNVSDQNNIPPCLVSRTTFDGSTQMPLNIYFKSAYSKLIVRLYPKSGDVNDLANIEELKVRYIPEKVEYNFIDDVYSSYTDVGEVTVDCTDLFDMYSAANVGKKAELMLLPVDLQVYMCEVSFIMDEVKYIIPISDLKWDPGKCYIYNATIDPALAEVVEVTTSNLLDWENGNPDNDDLVLPPT